MATQKSLNKKNVDRLNTLIDKARIKYLQDNSLTEVSDDTLAALVSVSPKVFQELRHVRSAAYRTKMLSNTIKGFESYLKSPSTTTIPDSLESSNPRNIEPSKEVETTNLLPDDEELLIIDDSDTDPSIPTTVPDSLESSNPRDIESSKEVETTDFLPDEFEDSVTYNFTSDLNGDSPSPTTIPDASESALPPTTVLDASPSVTPAASPSTALTPYPNGGGDGEEGLSSARDLFYKAIADLGATHDPSTDTYACVHDGLIHVFRPASAKHSWICDKYTFNNLHKPVDTIKYEDEQGEWLYSASLPITYLLTTTIKAHSEADAQRQFDQIVAKTKAKILADLGPASLGELTFTKRRL